MICQSAQLAECAAKISKLQMRNLQIVDLTLTLTRTLTLILTLAISCSALNIAYCADSHGVQHGYS